MKNLKHLFTALLLLCATAVAAHDFEVGGIYYNILSETDKTVEVTFKGTSYNENSDEYSGSVVIPETVTVSETGTTVLKTYDAWTSTNKGNGGTTSQTSYTLNVEAGQILKFDWSVSSESNYDWLTITLDGTEIVKKSGVQSGSYEKTFTTAGTHTLVVKYTKDGSVNNGNDEGKIFNVTLNATLNSVDRITYSVTSIGQYAFSSCYGITSITIPNSVTSIGDAAFSGCSRPTSITIPNSVTSIGQYAFSGCSGLTSITIPNSVTSIGQYTFSGCFGLTSIEIPSSVTSIGKWAFANCTGLTSIEIPNSVTSIGDYAFRVCSGLTSITIPNSVTSIGQHAFECCYELKSFTSLIPAEDLYSIISNVFDYVDQTSCTLYVPYGAKETYASTEGWNEFTNIVELGKPASDVYFRILSEEEKTAEIISGENKYTGDVVIPESVIYNGEEYRVTSIGESAFEYCSGLTSVVIPNTVTTIGDYAFYYCGNLISAPIPNSITNIGYYAFLGCSNLTSVTIPNSVTTIERGAFARCGFTNIVIPSSVTSIEEGAFAACHNLANIVVDENNPVYDSRENCNAIIDTESNKLIAACRNTVIPNSVTIIENYAFMECYSHTSLEIHNGVTTIGESAFRDCDNLTSVEIPNSVTSIGDYAFYECDGLTSITSLIPADKLFVPGSYAFWCVPTNCTLYVPFGAKETYAATGGWSEFTNIVELGKPASDVYFRILSEEEKTAEIISGENKYTGDVVIPESVIYNGEEYRVTSIGDDAFCACYDLTSVVLPTTVTLIEDGAFDSCYRLTSIEIPNGVTSIGKWAFSSCYALKSVTIPNSVTTIEEAAFYYCI